MSYKCVSCGHIFEDCEQAEWEEKHGLDTPPYEKFVGCPLCGCTYEETVKCECCGADFLEEELTYRVCEDCLEQEKNTYRYNPQKCYELSKDETAKVEINYFLSCMFTEKQIEEILLLNIRKASALMPIDCSAFMDADNSWFEERVVEEVKKSENG
jgi:hypothetical protein